MRTNPFARTKPKGTTHLRLHRSPPVTTSPSSPCSLRHPATPHPSNPLPRCNTLSALAIPAISILPPTPTQQTRSSSSSVTSVFSAESVEGSERVSGMSTRSINDVLSERRREMGLGRFEDGDIARKGVLEPRGFELEGAYTIVGIGEVLEGGLAGQEGVSEEVIGGEP